MWNSLVISILNQSPDGCLVIICHGMNYTYTVLFRRFVFSSESDVDNLVDMTRATGTRLLFELNLQLREGYNWDPINTISLFDYFTEKGYGDNIDFELGNGGFYLRWVGTFQSWSFCYSLSVLTYSGQDKMAVIWRQYFQMHFCEWKCLNFDPLKLHWSLFLGVRLTKIHHRFRYHIR